MKNIKAAIKLLSKSEHKSGLPVLVLVMGMALLETIGVASIMPFLALLGNPELINTHNVLSWLYKAAGGIGVKTPSDFLVLLGGGSFLLILVSAIYKSTTIYFMNKFIQLRQHSIGARLLKTYLAQPYDFFLERHSAEMAKKILSEVYNVVGSVLHPIIYMFANTLVLCFIIALLLFVQPWLSVFVALLLMGAYLSIYLFLRQRLTRLGDTLVRSDERRFMAADSAFGSIKISKLLGREESFLAQFNSPSKTYAATLASIQTMNQIPKHLIEAVAIGGALLVVLVLMFEGGGVENKTLGYILPILGLYAFAAYRLQPSVQAIFIGITNLRFGQAALESLQTDLAMERGVCHAARAKAHPLRALKRIELRGLSYSYPNSKQKALTDINIAMEVGSTVGLVGGTGAGKTTFVDIILGLLRPEAGGLFVDGIPVPDEEIRNWQASLGYVPQEVFLIDTSIAQNIALGVQKEDIDLHRLEASAKMAQLHDFIMRDLPAKYESQVGERGVRLSGGQRQRIGIARALYNDPSILVFDEATSALDGITEESVMKAISRLPKEKTKVIIAHRISTVRGCDHIIMLDGGKVEAQGSYEELSKTNEKFRKFAGMP